MRYDHRATPRCRRLPGWPIVALLAALLALILAGCGTAVGESSETERLGLGAASTTEASTSTTQATEPPTTVEPTTTRQPTTTRRKTTATTRPATTSPPADCHPSYIGECLHVGVGDYDCAGGSGNGPNYVYGTVRVRGSDPFDLDRDGDGLGCE